MQMPTTNAAGLIGARYPCFWAEGEKNKAYVMAQVARANEANRLFEQPNLIRTIPINKILDKQHFSCYRGM